MTLKEYLEKRKIGVTKFSRIMKMPQSTCSSWANHEKIPGRESMQKIFTLTGGLVTPNDFYGIGQ
jgi:hypothetical protein